jgi:hypothetical protein
MSLLETLMNRIAGRQRERADTYAALVRSVADGKRVDADQAESVLHNAGKSPAALAADVAELQRRRQLREQVAAADRGRARRKEILAELQVHVDRLAQAERDHEKAVQPLREELKAIERQAMEADRAKALLQQSRPAELRERETVIGQQLLELQRRREAIVHDRERVRGKAQQRRELAQRTGSEEQREDCLQEAARIDEREASMDAAIAEIDKERATLLKWRSRPRR